jgi:cell division protein FtsB
MAYLNNQRILVDSVYPEITPVTERSVYRRPFLSHHRKHTSLTDRIIYTGVIVALLFGLIQCARTLIGDSFSVSRLMQHKASVENFYKQTLQENQQLDSKIKLYSSASGIEELARNYLNMVGKDEIPVRFQ